jgi:hypothetical protein
MGPDNFKPVLRLDISGRLEQRLVMTPRIRRKLSDKEIRERNLPPKLKKEKKP